MELTIDILIRCLRLMDASPPHSQLIMPLYTIEHGLCQIIHVN